MSNIMSFSDRQGAEILGVPKKKKTATRYY